MTTTTRHSNSSTSTSSHQDLLGRCLLPISTPVSSMDHATHKQDTATPLLASSPIATPSAPMSLALWQNRIAPTVSTPTPPTTSTTRESMNTNHDQQQQQQQQQRHSVPWFLMLGDVLVAASVTAVVAPSLTIIDKALVQSSAGTHSPWTSVQESVAALWHRPGRYFVSPTFGWMWLAYATTYSTANLLKTLTTEETTRSTRPTTTTTRPNESPDQQSTTATTAKTNTTASSASLVFVGTTLANSTLSMLKDRAYARMFAATSTSTSTTPMTIPRTAYGLWMARDLTVIGSSFVLPPLVAQQLQTYQENHVASSTSSSWYLTLAQLVTPLAAQVVAGPLHYMGLDIVHHQHSQQQQSWRDRWMRLQPTLLRTVIPARMIRILPGYSLAGIWNQSGRQAWHQWHATTIEEDPARIQMDLSRTKRAITTTTSPLNASASSSNIRASTTADQQQQKKTAWWRVSPSLTLTAHSTQLPHRT